MTPVQRRALEALRELPLADDDPNYSLENVNIEDILDGSEALDISHAGGEFAELAKELNDDIWKS